MTKILFMGRKQISANLLRLLSSQDGIEIVGVLTDSHLQGSPTTAAAKELGLPLYTFDTALEAMKEGRLKYDLGLSVLYWRKLRDEFLTIPSLGTINFHPALLPEYKGTGGYNLAIMDELSEWGSTAHYVDASIDTGRFSASDIRADLQALCRGQHPGRSSDQAITVFKAVGSALEDLTAAVLVYKAG